MGQNTESIVGTITGAQTPAVPGTSITLLNTGIGESKVGEFGAMGNYQFLELLPGMSKVTVEASGFKQLVRSGTGVTVNNASRIDAALQVSGVNETVEVVPRFHC